MEFNCVVGDKAMRLEFALGDRVRFTRNDYGKQLTNGTLGTVVMMQQRDDGWQFVIVGDDNRKHIISQQDYCDDKGRLQLVHAYASTVYASQGLTVDETFVLHDPQMDRASGYVAGSRHRDACHWFCNSKALDEIHAARDDAERLQHLAKGLSEDRYQILALERWVQLHPTPEPQRDFKRGNELEVA